MIQIKNKKKNGRPILEKKDSSVRHFSHQLVIAREMPKTKRKNPDKNIPTAQQQKQ